VDHIYSGSPPKKGKEEDDKTLKLLGKGTQFPANEGSEDISPVSKSHSLKVLSQAYAGYFEEISSEDKKYAPD